MTEVTQNDHLSRILHDAIQQFAPPLKPTGAISLGTHCYTSWVLKSAGLKTASMPFDWLFSSSRMIRHCLDDDFATFLDRDFYRPVPIEEREAPSANVCQHLYYLENFGVKFVFNHRDPTTDVDYKYIQRCVERFRLAARDEGRKILFTTFRDHAYFAQEFFALRDTASRYFRNCFLVGAAIKPATGAPPQTEWIARDENSALMMFSPASSWMGLEFQSYFDDIALMSSFVSATSRS